MRVLITAGPSSEPIDEVRVITNRSTGELGTVFAQRFAQAGYEVELLLGEGATFLWPGAERFTTNDELERLLGRIAATHTVNFVFHAAALTDFRVKSIKGGQMRHSSSKIASDAGSVWLELTAQPKLISGLRARFSNAQIIGWKYEHDLSRAELLKEAAGQIERNNTDACVVNGRSFGPGFGIFTKAGLIATCESKSALADFFVRWMSRSGQGRAPARAK
jgi:phosphopantothenate---cysteine ligase (CTP)